VLKLLREQTAVAVFLPPEPQKFPLKLGRKLVD
jgi:hypothetical protein